MKKFCMSAAILLAFFMGSCSNVKVAADQNNPVKIWTQNTNGAYHTLVVIDEDTGVNYIVVSAHIYGSAATVTMSPRLNEDGSLYVTK